MSWSNLSRLFSPVMTGIVMDMLCFASVVLGEGFNSWSDMREPCHFLTIFVPLSGFEIVGAYLLVK